MNVCVCVSSSVTILENVWSRDFQTFAADNLYDIQIAKTDE